MDIRGSLDGSSGDATAHLPWLLLAVAAWRAVRVDDRRDEPGAGRSLHPSAAREEQRQASAAQRAPLPANDRALAVMEMAPSSWMDAVCRMPPSVRRWQT